MKQQEKPGFYWRPPGSREAHPIPKEAAEVLRLGGFDVWEVRPSPRPSRCRRFTYRKGLYFKAVFHGGSLGEGVGGLFLSSTEAYRTAEQSSTWFPGTGYVYLPQRGPGVKWYEAPPN